jgi:RNA polymerase sigma-70 factor (sigma-E family)
VRRDEAFEEFVADASARLLRSAQLLTGDRASAEDVLQLTLLRVSARWASAQLFPEAYARRVLVNLVRDRHRNAGRRVVERPLAEGRAAALTVVEDDPADQVIGRDAVIDALGRLPARQREVLVLRFYADLSVAQTAAATGRSEGTVKSDTSRALAEMRELLSEERLAAVPRATVREVEHDH